MTSFAAGDRPNSVAVADLDGDADLDLVTSNSVSDAVNVLLGNGDGTFEAPRSFEVGDFPHCVAVANLDGDTLPDLVTANSFSDDVTVLQNLPEPGQGLMLGAGIALLSLLERLRPLQRATRGRTRG